MNDPKDLRIEERRKLHCTAHVLVAAAPVMSGRTIDISSQAISVTLAEHLEKGDACVISVDTTIGGTRFKFATRAKVIYSIYSGTAFRTGFLFVQLDGQTGATIRTLYQQLFI